ncbi:MAG: hypothetical protein KA407_02465 [Spirochaetes bacterium]|nr:hypothetical protein [Spirochaetota bacterium]
MDDVDRDERRDEEIKALHRQEARVAEANKELRMLVLHLLIITKNLLR